MLLIQALQVQQRLLQKSPTMIGPLESAKPAAGVHSSCILAAGYSVLGVRRSSAYLTGRKARIALSTARTVTPTSAKTAIHIVATPSRARSSTNTLIPMANQAF